MATYLTYEKNLYIKKLMWASLIISKESTIHLELALLSRIPKPFFVSRLLFFNFFIFVLLSEWSFTTLPHKTQKKRWESTLWKAIDMEKRGVNCRCESFSLPTFIIWVLKQLTEIVIVSVMMILLKFPFFFNK